MGHHNRPHPPPHYFVDLNVWGHDSDGIGVLKKEKVEGGGDGGGGGGVLWGGGAGGCPIRGVRVPISLPTPSPHLK